MGDSGRARMIDLEKTKQLFFYNIIPRPPIKNILSAGFSSSVGLLLFCILDLFNLNGIFKSTLNTSFYFQMTFFTSNWWMLISVGLKIVIAGHTIRLSGWQENRRIFQVQILFSDWYFSQTVKIPGTSTTNSKSIANKLSPISVRPKIRKKLKVWLRTAEKKEAYANHVRFTYWQMKWKSEIIIWFCHSRWAKPLFKMMVLIRKNFIYIFSQILVFEDFLT